MLSPQDSRIAAFTRREATRLGIAAIALVREKHPGARVVIAGDGDTRATLVGEVTGGGANPGEGYSLGHGFAAFIPNGRSINPVTHTNWEHTGVSPDIAVPAADAQKVAHAAILALRRASYNRAPDSVAGLIGGSAASISPSSMRKPRILTWSSSRPRSPVR